VSQPLIIPRWGLWIMLAASVLGSVLLAAQLMPSWRWTR
jgi:hypothetical protein